MEAHSEPASADDFTWKVMTSLCHVTCPLIQQPNKAVVQAVSLLVYGSFYSCPSWIRIFFMVDPSHVQHAGQGGKMAKAIELKKVDEHRKPVKHLMAHQPQKPWQRKKQLANTMGITASSDDDNYNYDNLPPLESVVISDSESNSDDTLPSNAEVFIITVSLFHCDIWAYPVVDCQHSSVQDCPCCGARCFMKAHVLQTCSPYSRE